MWDVFWTVIGSQYHQSFYISLDPKDRTQSQVISFTDTVSWFFFLFLDEQNYILPTTGQDLSPGGKL